MKEPILDAAQRSVAQKLEALASALRNWRPGRPRLFGRQVSPPRGIYLWGDVGRGKTMLTDRFFTRAEIAPKRRVHFNAFMVETHARLHEWRGLDPQARARRPEFVRDAGDDPIPPVARAIAAGARLLCFDEFQVEDVADAMILGRLFEQLVALGVVIVATSNTPPQRLYEGGLNRQLFLPFIALIEEKLDVVELGSGPDYRLGRIAGLDLYVTPLGPDADAALDRAWSRLTDDARPAAAKLTVLGRTLAIPCATEHAARFSFDQICGRPLAAADYLAIARNYDYLVIDRIPELGPLRRDQTRRFTVLIDTLYDEGVKLICSAAAAPKSLFAGEDDMGSFRRTASRLLEMQSRDYLRRARSSAVSDVARAGAG
ncbi:MAG TPA: cell division protein ZapE [Rhizomicrobium sp.]|nr:cell division protein ZapE [Rhizomicrobium sp.]